jgi:hypothetical protein
MYRIERGKTMTIQCPVCNSPIQEQDTICSTCGFKFLGSTQSFQPVHVSGEEIVPPVEESQKSCALRIIRGPQIDAVLTLESNRYSIGRNPQNEIFLNDMTVSREHAFIQRVKEGFSIEDANSFNGVWVNNKSIDTCVLHDGDIVQIGAFCLLYQENQ